MVVFAHGISGEPCNYVSLKSNFRIATLFSSVEFKLGDIAICNVCPYPQFEPPLRRLFLRHALLYRVLAFECDHGFIDGLIPVWSIVRLTGRILQSLSYSGSDRLDRVELSTK